MSKKRRKQSGPAAAPLEARPLRYSFGALLPALVIGLAVLWNWLVWLRLDGWPSNLDITIFMHMGQQLAAGSLNWVDEFYDNKFLVNQFLFLLPALFDGAASFKVWLLMSMAACLAGAWAVQTILREVFSPARGFSPELGHYAGIYGGLTTLYLLSVVDEPHHINPLAVCMGLVAAALLKRSASRPGMGAKGVSAFLLSCFCASMAVGLRPHLAGFVSLIPVWVSIASQLEREEGRIDYSATAKFVLLWGFGAACFVLGVNVLPYALVGDLAAFFDGLAVVDQWFPPRGWPDYLANLLTVLRKMGILTTGLFYCWLAFLALFLIGLAGRFYHKAVAFELLILTLVVPGSMLALFLARHLWPHYAQMLAPFIGIGAVCLAVLLHIEKSRHLDFLTRHKSIACLLALLLALGPASEFQTRVAPVSVMMTPTATQNLGALLARLGLGSHDFLAPYNQYVHVIFRQPRHGFPNIAMTAHVSLQRRFKSGDSPARYRLPRNFDEYCQKLDEQGPRLVVFFKLLPHETAKRNPYHLAHCKLRRYDLHDVSAEARQLSDIAYYFVRRQS